VKHLAINANRQIQSAHVSAILFIADDRVTDVSHMHTDLMRSPGFDDQPQQGSLIERFHNLIPRYRDPPPGRRLCGHLFPVVRASAYERFDAAGGWPWNARDDGNVFFVDSPPFELIGKFPHAPFVLRNNERASGIFVKAVNKSRTDLPADSGKIAAAIQQGVDESAGRMSRRRMNHQPGRLIHHDYLRVLVQNIKRDILCGQFRAGLRRRDVNVNLHCRGNFCVRT
jgi:hypothetical protein